MKYNGEFRFEKEKTQLEKKYTYTHKYIQGAEAKNGTKLSTSFM